VPSGITTPVSTASKATKKGEEKGRGRHFDGKGQVERGFRRRIGAFNSGLEKKREGSKGGL